MTIAVPSSVAGRLAIYTDDQNTMEVVAPAGWTCRALYGADGSGGVVVFPAGEKVDDTGIGDGWHLTPASTVEVVVGGETSACGGCTTGQACPLFTAAARDYQTQFGRPCPVSRPTAETTDQISSGVKAFEDPPGVAGTGDPSGGVNPANGVMTYYGGNPDGSWAETCTLPPVDRSVCTVALNRFVTLYGTR